MSDRAISQGEASASQGRQLRDGKAQPGSSLKKHGPDRVVSERGPSFTCPRCLLSTATWTCPLLSRYCHLLTSTDMSSKHCPLDLPQAVGRCSRIPAAASVRPPAAPLQAAPSAATPVWLGHPAVQDRHRSVRRPSKGASIHGAGMPPRRRTGQGLGEEGV